ncbi:ABC transporter substrate-binding protein [Romboutsia sp.]|uniref:ABC transporter substrate-binding protein n=1 Tax=Romboutsia sp. TaxID=1965302 RepID=UPI003F3F07E1
MKLKKQLASIIMIGALMTGCAAGGQSTKKEESKDGKQVVTVWAWDKNFNIRVMEKAAEAYSKVNPDVKIEIVDYAKADVETKLHTNLSTGSTKNLPDIVLIEDYSAQKYLTSYPGMFEDLTGKRGHDKFAKYKVSSMTVDGKVYGVPFDSGVTGMFYRTDYLEQAGFKPEDLQNITWQRYLEIGKVIQEKTGKPLTCENLNEISGLSRIMMQSAKTWYFDNDGNVQIENNKALKEALTTLKEMKDTGVVKNVNGWDEWVGAMNDGTSATVVSGAWIMPSITSATDQSGKWALAPVPKLSTVDSVNASNLGGSSWYVLGGKDNKDAAIDFLNKTFGSDNDFYQTILTDIGAIGTYMPAQSGTSYEKESAFFSNQKVYKDFSKWMTEVPEVNYGVYAAEADKALNSVMADFYSEKITVDEALKAIQTQVQGQIK